MNLNEDFVYSADLIKSPSGFGLQIAQDPASNFAFITQPPTHASPVVSATYFGGIGGSEQQVIASGIMAYDMIMEISGEPMYGMPLNVVTQSLVNIPIGTKTTIKLRRFSQFRHQQMMMAQQLQFAQSIPQAQIAYSYSAPANTQYGITTPNRNTRHTYRPYRNGSFASIEYDADWLRRLGWRWISMVNRV